MKDIEAAFVGRVGTEAVELRTSAGGKTWSSFSVVVGDGDGAQWVKVAVFNERAAQLAGHLKKGARVYVEGRLKLQSWTSKSGEARTGLKGAGVWRVEQFGLWREQAREAEGAAGRRAAGAGVTHGVGETRTSRNQNARKNR